MGRQPRIALLLPGFCRDEEDPCIPVITNLARELAHSVDLTIYTAEYPYICGSYTVHGINVHSTGKSSGDRRNVRMFRLNRFVNLRNWNGLAMQVEEHHRQRPYDLIHAFWGTLPGYTATRTAARLGLPSVVSLAGGELAALPDLPYGSMLSLRSRIPVERSMQSASAITVGSRWLADLVPDHYRDHLHITPLGIDCSVFLPGRIRTGKKILAVGALIPVKNYSTIIRAIQPIVEVDPEVSLTIAGWDGDRKEKEKIISEISSRNLQKNVEILGDVDHAEMPRLYHEHDLLLHASFHEAQGMAVLEGLATGLPVIASNVGIATQLPPDLIRTFAPDDFLSLQKQIAELLQNVEYGETILQKGAEYIADEFSLEESTERFVNLYDQLLFNEESTSKENGKGEEKIDGKASAGERGRS